MNFILTPGVAANLGFTTYRLLHLAANHENRWIFEEAEQSGWENIFEY